MTERPVLSPQSAVMEQIPQMYRCGSTDNRTELWWQPDTVINWFHKENVCVCLKHLSLKTLLSLRALQALPWNLWDMKLLKLSLRFHSCHRWANDSWLHYPQHYTHDFLQGDLKKKSHLKEPISFIVVAQWKRPLLKYCTTLGPLLQLPNQIQLTGKCCTKMLLEVSH